MTRKDFFLPGIQTDGVLSGQIHVSRIKIRDDGKLIIQFRTKAKFRGLFVTEHRTFAEQVRRNLCLTFFYL